MGNSTNNKIPFFPFIFQKDFFGFILILCLYFLQTHFGVSSLSHTDNALEPCALLTPILILFLLGEVRNLTTLSLLPLVNNCFSLSFFFQSFLCFLWIGAQFPQLKFLSYARILTLYYYFLLLCILFS